VSSDYGTGKADGNDVDVFPMIELVSGEDTRVAFTDDVLAINELITGTAAKTITLNLPTGTVDVVTNATYGAVTIGGEHIAYAADASIAVGSVYYNFAVANGTAVNATDITVSVDATPNADSGAGVTTPGILFVEDEDKSNANVKAAIHIVTTDNVGSSGYSTVSAPLFSTAKYDTESWDNSDITGWLTDYGTYVWRDTGDSNQNFVGLSYGDAMMSANVLIAEGEVSTSTTDTGIMTVTDTEAASMTSKNMVVVGGSAINSIAAELLGGAYSEADFTAETGVSEGEFLIESFSRSGKTALLVAGYNKDDTSTAVTYLLNEDVDTTVGTKIIGTSATEATLVTA
jgi:hypothetical protein